MRWVDHFRQDERGSATIEFLLWVPIIVALLVIVIDATTLYVTHTEMWNVARDTARRMVTGSLDEDTAKDHVIEAMNLRDYPYHVITDYDQDNGVQVIIQLRVNDMSIIGYSPLTILGGDMTARVIMRPDPNGV